MLEKLLKTINFQNKHLFVFTRIMAYECKCVTCLNEIIYVH